MPTIEGRISVSDIEDMIIDSLETGGPDPDPEWDERKTLLSGSVVEYVGPNLPTGTLFIIIGVKCIGEETRKPIYWVEYFEGDEGRYGYGIHHKYLKKSKKQARINWEV